MSEYILKIHRSTLGDTVRESDSGDKIATTMVELSSKNPQCSNIEYMKNSIDNLRDIGGIALSKLSFNKEVYKPCTIEFELQFNFKDLSYLVDSKDQIFKSLKDRAVTLYLDEHSVAEYYYIFEIESKVRNLGTIYTTIKAYSKDAYLDRNCNCASYINKDMAEIFRASLTSFSGFASTDIAVNDTIYPQFGSDANSYLLPYSVQYNESTYSYLSRIAVRYGVFLFFEDGKITLGYNKKATVISIDNGDVRYLKNLVVTDYSNKLYNDLYIGGTTKPETESIKNTPRDGEKTIVAYYPISLTEKLTTAGSMVVEKAMLPAAIIGSLTAMDYISIFTKFSAKVVDSYMVGAASAFVLNKKYAEHIKSVSADLISYCEDVRDVDYTLRYQGREGREKALNNRVIITTPLNESSSYSGAKLGSIIEIADGRELDKDEVTYIYTYSKFIVTAIRSTSSDIGNINIEIEATAYNSDDINFPPTTSIACEKICSPQTAVVVDNYDPLKQGRVRVCYPWQESILKNKGRSTLVVDLPFASPWLSVATPSSSGGTGISSIPDMGDTVMINYDGGDIDKPYVSTIVRTYVKDQAGGLYGIEDYSIISTRNGQKITFYSLDTYMGFIASVMPALSTVSKYFPASEWAEVESGKGLEGSIKISDKNGFFKLEASTDERSITIESTIGDVLVSSFTGINVSAPLGDIEIEGKNINITAGNNLNITSGKNVKKLRRTNFIPAASLGASAMSLLSTAFSTLYGSAQLIDVSLLRCVVEAVIKPVGGKMIIKSNRFLHIIAGAGGASEQDITCAGQRNFWPESQQLFNIMTNVSAFLQAAIAAYRATKNRLLRLSNQYTRYRATINASTAALSNAINSLDDGVISNDAKGYADNFATKFPTADNISSTTVIDNDIPFSANEIASLPRGFARQAATGINNLQIAKRDLILAHIAHDASITASSIIFNDDIGRSIKTFLGIDNTDLVAHPLDPQILYYASHRYSINKLVEDTLTSRNAIKRRASRRAIFMLLTEELLSFRTRYGLTTSEAFDADGYLASITPVLLTGHRSMTTSLSNATVGRYINAGDDNIWSNFLKGLKASDLDAEHNLGSEVGGELLDMAFGVSTWKRNIAEFGLRKLPAGELFITNSKHNTQRISKNLLADADFGSSFQADLIAKLNEYDRV